MNRGQAVADPTLTTIRSPGRDSPRVRWLTAHEVYTECVDAGIGCCWFAYQGTLEPVNGETEDAAIVRLAGERGLELWRDAKAGEDAAD